MGYGWNFGLTCCEMLRPAKALHRRCCEKDSSTLSQTCQVWFNPIPHERSSENAYKFLSSRMCWTRWIQQSEVALHLQTSVKLPRSEYFTLVCWKVLVQTDTSAWLAVLSVQKLWLSVWQNIDSVHAGSHNITWRSVVGSCWVVSLVVAQHQLWTMLRWLQNQLRTNTIVHSDGEFIPPELFSNDSS